MISDEKLHFLERFGDSDHQDMAKEIFRLRVINTASDKLVDVLKAQIAELEHSQMKKENAGLRKNLAETNKNYVEVVNENLELRRELGR